MHRFKYSIFKKEQMKNSRINYKTVMMLLAVILLGISCTQNNKSVLFQTISSGESGVDFSNDILETEKMNILEYIYMYNGGGIAVGDVNNDGLSDLYFTSNQESNKLYLNKGGFKFEDHTEIANVGGVTGELTWTNGVTMVDINNDGWLDIYVCQLHGFNGIEGTNQLYVNNGDGTFVEKGAEYGLNIASYSQQAVFFDYDLDGDLDMYLLNQAVHTTNSYKTGTRRNEREPMSGDQLFQNTNGKFKDISENAGIYGGAMGYGLAVTVGDVNNDRYPDIYVSNDFHENDYLYYNQGDGTFKEDIANSMGHISKFSMGSAIADINNDGWMDVMTMDMKAQDEKTLKMSVSSEDYSTYLYKLDLSYHHQYPRNMLHINRGKLFNDGVQFSEIGEYSGVAATDWSWGVTLADFDLDGSTDIFITNGIPRRPNDLDYINFTSNEQQGTEEINLMTLISSMPEGKNSNIAYKNNGKIFEDTSIAWGINTEGYSNGSVYADLDNDGDLDLVVNNLNAKASLYQNTAAQDVNTHYLKINFKGSDKNVLGVGARVTVHSDKDTQTQELYPVKGWLSTMDHNLVFGLGASNAIQDLEVLWYDGKIQILNNIPVDTAVTLNYKDAEYPSTKDKDKNLQKKFQNIDHISGIDFKHEENDFIDFEYEKIIPRMLSTEGPKMSIGDVNNDGLDDFYIGGAKNQSGQIYVQNATGNTVFSKIESSVFFRDRASEDAESVFLDVDNDGDLDLYVVSAGSQPYKDFTMSDRLYLNDGVGNFVKSNKHPQLNFNGSCAITGDFNRDGITDVFVGARSIPGSYGSYIRSRILLGDGKGKFYDKTDEIFGTHINLGMVTDATWLKDSNELIVVGEWMPVTILDFKKFPLEEKIIENTEGWWNTIHAADIDGDNDLDFLVGNSGLNSNLKASNKFPVNLYLKDFDINGSLDPILTHYKKGKEYPYFGLTELSRQLTQVKKVFQSYEEYASSTFLDVFPIEELKGASRIQAFTFKSTCFENKGNGDFVEKEIPEELQLAPLYSFATGDFENSGELEILAGGNFYANQISIGKHDASFGHLFKINTSTNSWDVTEPKHSGFAVQGEVRDIKILNGSSGKKLILVSRNNDSIKLFTY
tara:strand:- start:3113 stop:6454 length:3342 start_codon:yes stop_codon:yes gene_type:complete